MDMGLCGIKCRPSLQPSVPLLGQRSQPGLVPGFPQEVAHRAGPVSRHHEVPSVGTLLLGRVTCEPDFWLPFGLYTLEIRRLGDVGLRILCVQKEGRQAT